MTIHFQQRIEVPSDVMVSQLAGESVLLNLKTESYFGLDEVGTTMWEALRMSPSIEHAYDRLRNEFDVDDDTLKADLNSFLEQLVAHGLIQLAPPVA